MSLTYLDLTRNGYFYLEDIGLVSTRPWLGRPVPRVMKPKIDRQGYLQYCVRIDGEKRHVLQHRIAWEATYGTIPEGLQINHINSIRDDNRIENLEVVTPSENTRHGYEFGNVVAPDNRGEKHGNSKLTESQVREIHGLREQGWTQQKIAARFEVSQRQVGRILGGECWGHIFH